MPNKNSIFRSEAIEHRTHHWLGNPQVIMPVGASVWTIIALVIIVSLVVFMIIGTYTQKVRLMGEIIYEPAVARIEATGNGTIVRSFAVEGKEVRAGDVIFIVNMETQTEYGRTSHEITSALKSQKTAIEREIMLKSEASDKESDFLTQRLKNKEAEIQELDNLITKSTEQVAWLFDKAQLFNKLVGKGIALEIDHIERRSDYYTASVQLAAYKREKVKLQGESLDIRARLATIHIGLETSRETLRRDIARLDQDLVSTEERRELYITSPIDGKLTGITGLVGKRIRSSQELASVVPTSGRPKVEIFSTSEVIGELREGQSVKLRFDAYPYQWFGQHDGIVTAISTTSVEGSLGIKDENNQQQKRYFQVHIRPKSDGVLLAGNIHPLRPGMGVETDIFIRKRPIYEWILLPLKRIHVATQGKPGDDV
ncbi:Colicin V secretion protein CvaA [Photorhabdus australis subsp. thailandensis]|uniref:Colicin V secretion protein CvaA n=2 Tax=Photorhabdus australis TaxID=286156 RepID=A0A1C0TZC9_9GAMM|nr:Colicin V secretion protein CvaA [Photorhabdus australis subsp. thailandensis]